MSASFGLKTSRLPFSASFPSQDASANQGGGAMRRDPFRNDGFHSVTLFAPAPAAMHARSAVSSPAA